MPSVNPVRLNHAVLFVTDLERAERFYTDVIGMSVAAREPRANTAFLRLPRSATITISACSVSVLPPRSTSAPQRQRVAPY